MKDTGYFNTEDCDLQAFATLCGQSLSPDSLRFTGDVRKNIPVYDMPALEEVLNDPAARQELLGEWGWVLGQSAGVFVLSGAYQDCSAIDAATTIYNQIIAREKAAAGEKADHFAASHQNRTFFSWLLFEI